jgi:hypothetical protein
MSLLTTICMTRQQSHADALAIQQRSFDEQSDAIRVVITNGEIPIPTASSQEVRIERVEVPFVVEKEVKEIVYVDRPVIVEKIVIERIEIPVVVREAIIERVEVPVIVKETITERVEGHSQGSNTHTTNIVEKDIPIWAKVCIAAQTLGFITLLLKMILN